jgi:hypothetical protein
MKSECRPKVSQRMNQCLISDVLGLNIIVSGFGQLGLSENWDDQNRYYLPNELAGLMR